MAVSDRSATWEASAFHPGFEGGRAPGRVSLDSGHLRFAAGDGATGAGRVIDLPLAGIELRLGGAADRILFFSHPAHPEVSIFTSDHTVLAHPELRSRRELTAQIAAVGRKKQRSRLVLAALLGGVVALIVGLVLLKDPLVGVVADQVPPSLEIRLGNLIYSQLEPSLALIEDPAVDAGVEQLAAPLLAALPDTGYPFTLHVVEDPELNAFALPGGHIVLHSGLLLRAETPEEVLGVLAHELAHVTRRHSLRNVISTVGLVALVQTVLGDASALVAAVANGGTRLLTLRFSRDFEREADDVGWEYLVAAGVDPGGMIRLFEKLQEAAAERGTAELESSLSFLNTHPSSPERIARLEARLQELGADAPAPLDPAPFHDFQSTLRQQLNAAAEPQSP